jgi:hypothetical protein
LTGVAAGILVDEAGDAEDGGAGVRGLDLGDQGGVLGAEGGGGEVGPDRQRRERDGDVVGELGVGPRVGDGGRCGGARRASGRRRGGVMSPSSAGVEQAPGQSVGEATRLDLGPCARM